MCVYIYIYSFIYLFMYVFMYSFIYLCILENAEATSPLAREGLRLLTAAVRSLTLSRVNPIYVCVYMYRHIDIDIDLDR